MSPTFVKILIIHYENGNRQLLYLPLSFKEALACALTARGFQPIVVKQKELNKIKMRKLTMALLVVQTFQNLKGPILVLLPGINPNETLKIDNKLIEVLHNNEIKFNRWTVGFSITTPSILNIYMNQIDLITQLLQRFSLSTLKVEMTQFHRNINYQQNFHFIISRFLSSGDDSKVRQITYQSYIQQLNNQSTLSSNSKQESSELSQPLQLQKQKTL